MIVLRVAFVSAVLARRHPMQIIREPLTDCHQVLSLIERRESFKHLDCPRDFHQVNRVDDADAASGEPPMNRLCILQVGIHARLVVDKPRREDVSRHAAHSVHL